MTRSNPISVTLPGDMAAMVKARVASGEYETEGDVILGGLRALQDRDAAVETWLREDVAKSVDEYAADPGAAIPADQILPRLRAAHRARRARTVG